MMRNGTELEPSSSFLFHPGPVRVTAERVEEAILIVEGRVGAVGSLTNLRAAKPDDTREIDLAGATIIPGPIDTHPYLVHFATLSAHLVDLFDTVDHADIVDRTAAPAITEAEGGAWIMATPVGDAHYFIRRSWCDLAEGKLPDRTTLDLASSTHPIFIQAWAPVTPNVCAFNSVPVTAVGIDDKSPSEIEGVTIHKDSSGRPTGLLSGAVENYYSK